MSKALGYIGDAELAALVKEIAKISDNPPDLLQIRIEIGDGAAARAAMAQRIVERLCQMTPDQAAAYLFWQGAEQVLRPLAHLVGVEDEG